MAKRYRINTAYRNSLTYRGLNVAWTESSPTSATWTKQTPTTATWTKQTPTSATWVRP